MGSRPQKRIYLVNRDFQLRYARSAMVVGFISTVLTAALILWPLYVFEILRIPKFLPLPILIAMIVPAVVNVLFIAMMGVLLTHKIVGPMYSLIRYMRQVERGNLAANIRLRDGDELKYVIRNFNGMVEALILSTYEDLDQIKNITSILQDLRKDSKDQRFDDALNVIESLEAKCYRKLANTEKIVQPKSQL